MDRPNDTIPQPRLDRRFILGLDLQYVVARDPKNQFDLHICQFLCV